MTTLAFTGTREGMTEAQKISFRRFVVEFIPETFLHGDCKGSDAEAVEIVRTTLPATRIISYPPKNTNMRAFAFSHETKAPKDYHQRNRDLVDDCTSIACTPKQDVEQYTGGTWYTSHYAMKRRKQVYVIWPKGSVERLHAREKSLDTLPASERKARPEPERKRLLTECLAKVGVPLTDATGWLHIEEDGALWRCECGGIVPPSEAVVPTRNGTEKPMQIGWCSVCRMVLWRERR
jgi:hypothetical protein